MISSIGGWWTNRSRTGCFAARRAIRSAGAIFAGSGDVDREGATLEFLAVEHVDRLLGFGGGCHVHEREARDLPVNLSIMTLTEPTFPAAAKNSRRSPSEV